MDGIKGLGGLGSIDLAGLTQTAPQSLEKLSKGKGEVEATTKGGKSAEEAATQFEGLLIQEMLKSMWKGVPKGELLSGSNEEDMYRDMLNEAVATSISEGRSIGVRDVILKDIEKLEKK